MKASVRGMTLIEVVMGTVVVGLVISAASWALSGSTTTAHGLAEAPIDAALLAKEIHELALRQAPVDDGDPPATTAAGVHGLDSLDGASFSPPLNASLAQISIANASLWRQDVDLQVFKLSDLSHPSSEDFSGASKSSNTLFKLTVHVTCRTTDMGTWWWWINP